MKMMPEPQKPHIGTRHEDNAPGDHRRRASDESEGSLERAYARAIKDGDPGVAQEVIDAASEQGMRVEEVQARIIAPAMRWIGDCWQSGEATVADEHLATAITQDILARLFRRALHAGPRSRERVVLAAAQGEHHALGLRMAADVLEGAGFDVLYLGADIPLPILLETCRKHTPAALGMSVSMPLNVPTLIAEIQAVCALPHPPAIFVAGRAAAAAIALGLNVPVIETVEATVGVVEALLAAPPKKVVPDALTALVPDTILVSEAAAPSKAEAFSRTAKLGADSVRESVRHAYEMEQLAYRDALTGLWNRRAYDDRFFDLQKEDGSAVMLLAVDVDGFKSINDSFGHEVGDATLVRVGDAMLGCVRPGDFSPAPRPSRHWPSPSASAWP
jgi:methanogenic corrinoid protein MtbC1